MNDCSDPRHRSSQPRRDCARDSIGDIDPMRVDVNIDNRSDLPLEYWRDRLKRPRRKIGPRREPSETPSPPEHPPPEGTIDEYAAGRT